MAKILVLYTSMTGNTEEMANAIVEGILSENHEQELDLKDSLEATAADLIDYDGIIIGSYTWNDGDLPDEFIDFFVEMNEYNLTGKKAAVFGSGDSCYDVFCGAVDTIEAKLTELGADVVLEGLKVELSPEPDDLVKCQSFGGRFVNALN